MGKNYYSMYNKSKPEVTNEDTAPEAEAVAVDPKEKETQLEPKKVQKAVITGCTCLNVRSATDINASIVGIISANDKVIVDVNNSCDLWCAVELKNKTKGYSMRKFLKFI